MYIRVNGRDNVAIVVSPDGVSSGALLPDGLTAREAIPQSHKIALSDLDRGEPVLRYGQIIGYANRPIARGSWVRKEFLDLPAPPQLDRLPLSTAVPDPLPPLTGFTFEGYRNPDGSTGTRNILGIATTVQCVAPTVDYAVRRIRDELLPRFPNVDDVVVGDPFLRMRRGHRRARRGHPHPHAEAHLPARQPDGRTVAGEPRMRKAAARAPDGRPAPGAGRSQRHPVAGPSRFRRYCRRYSARRGAPFGAVQSPRAHHLSRGRPGSGSAMRRQRRFLGRDVQSRRGLSPPTCWCAPAPP